MRPLPCCSPPCLCALACPPWPRRLRPPRPASRGGQSKHNARRRGPTPPRPPWAALAHGPAHKAQRKCFFASLLSRSLFVAVDEPRLSRCWFREPLKAAARRVGPAARLARTHLEEGVRARCARRGDAGGKARLPGGQLTGRTGRGHAVGGLGQRRGGCVPGRPAGCLRGGGHAARAIEDGDRARRVEWIARRRVVVRHGHDEAQVRAQAAQVAWGAPASAATLRRRTPRRVRGARDVSHAASCPTATSTLS